MWVSVAEGATLVDEDRIRGGCFAGLDKVVGALDVVAYYLGVPKTTGNPAGRTSWRPRTSMGASASEPR
jgi:hypothetical protein